MPAPIVVFCYNRPDHLKRTVENLQRNKISEKSIIYFFSDGHKSELDALPVSQVREYLHKVSGFKEIILEFSSENKGLANSVIDGVSKVIQKYGSAIVLEDDILVSEDFLDFMNNALQNFIYDKRIFSISGYSFLLENCPDAGELNMVRRASSWGWATWQDRWESVDWSSQVLDSILKNKELISKLKFAGSDMPVMLKKQILGIINSWAIRWTCHHLLNNAFCVVPKYSKVKNIGTDGSGTHFTEITNKFSSMLNENHISMDKELNVNTQVNYYIKNKFSSSIYRKILNYLKYGIA